MLTRVVAILPIFGSQTLAFLPANHIDSQREPQCHHGEFQCHDQACLPLKWTCDGDEDCSGGEDESPILCSKARTCLPSQFPCTTSGSCVPQSWLCDSHNDCDDGSDEVGCSQTTSCSTDEFTCANGRCTQTVWKCDGEDDCGDGSDEQGCRAITCAQGEVQCQQGNCITANWVCDGDADCANGEDELRCEGVQLNISQVCSVNEFRCRDQHFCVHQAWVCDGDQDCPDGTDEDESRCGPRLRCEGGQFMCSDGKQCVPVESRCDGGAQCSDHSDEEGCETPAPTCSPTAEFDCFGDGRMCVALSKVCDGTNNCGGWEDEPERGCGVDECAKENGGCDQICVDTPKSFHCSCRQGWRLQDRTKCVDIDECATPGFCSQTCINRPGSHKCDCVDGYLKDPATGRCKATEGRPDLLFAHKTDIRKISLDRLNMENIGGDTRSSCALDYAYKAGLLFWSDVMDEKIYSARIGSGHNRTVVVDSGVVTADGLAVDWVYSHLYWTDTGTNSISVSDFSGRQRAVLLQDRMEEPRAIALHPGQGWMFWSDWGRDPKIERAGMDGTHREVIVRGSVRWPNGLTLDLVLDRLYWVDAKLSTVGSADLDGSNARIVLYSSSTLRHPFSISVFEDWMYWSEWETRTVYRADKFSGANATALTGSLSQLPMVVQVYHPQQQPSYPDLCLSSPCSHLCLPAPRLRLSGPSTSCACPEGWLLRADRRTCEERTTVESTSPKSTTGRMPGRVATTGLTRSTTGPAPGLQGDAAVQPLAQDDPGLPAAAIAAGCVLLLAALLAGVLLLLYRRRQTKHMATIKFDNPVFRRPGTSMAPSLEARISSVELDSSQVSSTALTTPLDGL